MIPNAQQVVGGQPPHMKQSLSRIYCILHTIYSKHRLTHRENSDSKQMCCMWSTDDPPDIIEGTDPICDIEDAFHIQISEGCNGRGGRQLKMRGCTQIRAQISGAGSQNVSQADEKSGRNGHSEVADYERNRRGLMPPVAPGQMERAKGFEPSTSSLARKCSTN